jgi:heme exporter protein C
MKNAWQTGLGLVTLAAMVVAVYMALVGAPTEAEQGMVQRIFYFHVPAAMVSFVAI